MMADFTFCSDLEMVEINQVPMDTSIYIQRRIISRIILLTVEEGRQIPHPYVFCIQQKSIVRQFNVHKMGHSTSKTFTIIVHAGASFFFMIRTTQYSLVDIAPIRIYFQSDKLFCSASSMSLSDVHVSRENGKARLVSFAVASEVT